MTDPITKFPGRPSRTPAVAPDAEAGTWVAAAGEALPRRGRTPDPMVLERVAELTRLGRTAAEIALEIRRTPRTVNRYRTALGIAKPHTVPIDDDTKAAARVLLDDGASYAEVARTLGVSRSTVASWWPGRAWTHEQCGAHGAFIRDHVNARREAA